MNLHFLHAYCSLKLNTIIIIHVLKIALFKLIVRLVLFYHRLILRATKPSKYCHVDKCDRNSISAPFNFNLWIDLF